MIPDPTMLILLHHYRLPHPALDESDFLNHGLCQATQWQADGAKPGSGALAFGPHSVVKVGVAPSWANLRGLIIDVMVRFNGNDMQARRNIVEGDGCFAMYVAPGGELRFDFFALVAGQSAPGWHGVSSVANALGTPHELGLGRWYRLRAAFDGISTAKLWIDGVPVAQRSGFKSSIGSPGAAGVSIGNWTLSNQFPLMGMLDWVAVWKVDEDAIASAFVERLDTRAKDEWSRVFACLDRKLDDEAIASLLGPFEDLLFDVGECLAHTSLEVRADFLELLEQYHHIWATGLVNGAAFTDVVVRLYRLLTSCCPTAMADRIKRLSHLFSDIAGGRNFDCINPEALAAADPYFTTAFARFSSSDFN